MCQGHISQVSTTLVTEWVTDWQSKGAMIGLGSNIEMFTLLWCFRLTQRIYRKQQIQYLQREWRNQWCDNINSFAAQTQCIVVLVLESKWVDLPSWMLIKSPPPPLNYICGRLPDYYERLRNLPKKNLAWSTRVFMSTKIRYCAQINILCLLHFLKVKGFIWKIGTIGKSSQC